MDIWGQKFDRQKNLGVSFLKENFLEVTNFKNISGQENYGEIGLELERLGCVGACYHI